MFYARIDRKRLWKIRLCVGPKRRTWYVPIGVLIPSKHEIIVVFGSSSHYKSTSINQNLLSAPDLTNQLKVFYAGLGWNQ